MAPRPLSAVAWYTLGRLLLFDGQLGPAQAALEQSLQIAPEQNYASANLATVFLLLKRPAEALAMADRSRSDVFRLEVRALALRDLGREAESRRALDELIARFHHGAAFQIAEAFAALGDRERAFKDPMLQHPD